MNTNSRDILLSLVLLIGLTQCGKNSSPTDNPEEPVDDTIYIHPEDFLSDEKYDRLDIQIFYVDGYEPEADARYEFTSFLDERLHKETLFLTSHSIASPGNEVYSINDIKALEEACRSKYPTDSTLSLWIFVADGNYSENDSDNKTLGIAYGPTSIALFGKTIRAFSGGLNQPSTRVLEATVLKHEVCHLLGLVNNGSPMVTNHQDTGNGRHCSNKNCLMYYAAETSDFLQNFLFSSAPTLKDQCIQDLRANGGK